MIATGLGENMGIKLKNYRQYIQQEIIYLTAKQERKEKSLSIIVGLRVNFLYFIMQGNSKSGECQVNLFFFKRAIALSS